MRNERELEDYIINNQEEFVSKLLKKEFFKFLEEEILIRKDTTPEYAERDINNVKNTYSIDFVGRQISLNGVFCDVLFKVNYQIDMGENNFKKHCYYIVVELKNRKIEMKDYGQISKYMNWLELTEQKNESFSGCLGILLGEGCNDDVQDFLMATNIHNIVVVNFTNKIEYGTPSYSYTNTTIDNFTYDKRLKNGSL